MSNKEVVKKPKRSIPSSTLFAWCPKCNKRYVIDKKVIDKYDPVLAYMDCECGQYFSIDINSSLLE